MRKALSIGSLSFVFVWAIALVLVAHPTRVKGEEAKGGMEVKVGNFTFSPETLTVPVNSTVTSGRLLSSSEWREFRRLW